MLVNGNNVPHDTSKPILHSIESANIHVDAHCKEGFCGACRCRLEKGSVNYKVTPLASIQTGEIITCMAYADSNIEIYTS